MKSNAKKIVLLLALLVVPFMVTGCGKNSSAKDVAVEMVTKLSKDDYKNMDDIFYQEKDSYFDAFLQGKEFQKNDLHVQEVTVDYKTWNKDREYLPSMEYEIMDAMVRDLMASPSFIGILQ